MEYKLVSNDMVLVNPLADLGDLMDFRNGEREIFAHGFHRWAYPFTDLKQLSYFSEVYWCRRSILSLIFLNNKLKNQLFCLCLMGR